MRANRVRGASGVGRGGVPAGIPLDGLLLYYTMDNIQGATLVDEAGNHDGIISGATIMSGWVAFDGQNDEVNCGSGALAEAVADLTLVVRVENTDSGDAVYAGKYSAVPAFAEIGRSSSDDRFYFRFGSSGATNTTLKDTNTIASYGPGPLTVLGEYDSSAGVARIFVNNQLKNQVQSSRDVSRAGDILYLGRRGYPGAEEHGACGLHYVAGYNSVLTSAEKSLLDSIAAL